MARELHDTTGNPIALYQLTGSPSDTGSVLWDSSGNGRHLKYGFGPSTKINFVNGWRGLSYLQNDNHSSPLYYDEDNGLALTGALSVVVLIRMAADPGILSTVAGYGTNINSQALGWSWQVEINTNDTPMLNHISGTVDIFGLDADLLARMPDATPFREHWYHYGVTRDETGTFITSYINGNVIYTGTVAPPVVDGGGIFTIGGASGSGGVPTNTWQGTMSSLKIFDRELTEAEIRSEYNRCFNVDDTGTNLGRKLHSTTRHNPIAVYQLLADSRDDSLLLADSGSGGKNLIHAFGQIQHEPGFIGVCYKTEDNAATLTNEISGAADDDFNLTGDMSCYFWLRVDTISGGGVFKNLVCFSGADDTPWAYRLQNANGYFQYVHYSGGLQVALTSSLVNYRSHFRRWSHVGFVRTGSQVDFYFSGRRINSATFNPATSSVGTSDPNRGLQIFGDSALPLPTTFNGAIQSIKILNTALTEDEMYQEYAYCAGLSGGTTLY